MELRYASALIPGNLQAAGGQCKEKTAPAHVHAAEKNKKEGVDRAR